MDKPAKLTRGQHHLPQFLLKGFASRATKKGVFTWLYRAGECPVEANVSGIAKTRDFYGNPATSSIEARLSTIESDFAPLVRRLRDGKPIEDTQAVCRFVASTQIRTANLRLGVADAMQSFVDQFGRALTNPKNQRGLQVTAFQGVLEKVAAGDLDHVLSQFEPKQRAQLLREMVPGLERYLHSSVQAMTQGLLERMPSLTETQAFNKQQNDILSDNLIPEHRVAQLAELHWDVILTPEPLVLGDLGVLGADISGELTNLLSLETTLDMVLFPLGTHCLLCGTRSSRPVPTVPTINNASAALSREFFIASVSDRHTDLSPLLATRAALLAEGQMESLVNSSFDAFTSEQ